MIIRRLALPTAVILVFAVLTWPVWRWLWGEWMGNDYYSHGILIVPVALYLAWRRLQNARAWSWTTLQGDNRGLWVLAISLIAYLYFLNGKAYYLAAFALIGLLVGIVWSLTGWRTLSLVAFPLAYLTLMAPLPFIERATLPLALFTGVCSSSFVRFFGMELTTVGNAITLPNAELVVGAQCSGINSMIALTAVNALTAYVVAGPMWGRLALVLAAVPIAMVGNIFRVANLLVVARTWGAEAAFDFYHTYSGLLFFALALLLLIPLAKLLRCSTLRLDVL
jgi:exosortase